MKSSEIESMLLANAFVILDCSCLALFICLIVDEFLMMFSSVRVYIFLM